MSNVKMLIHAFMTSRLDYYCNALLGGCSACLVNKLQMVQRDLNIRSVLVFCIFLFYYYCYKRGLNWLKLLKLALIKS